MSFELSTDLFNMEQLRETDLGVYDSFYLGNPFCLLHKGNFSIEQDDLYQAAEILKGKGKKIYLTTPSAPRGQELERIETTFSFARDIGVDGIEYHNLGVLYKASREIKEIPAQAGVFANIYTQVAAELLKDYGVVRIRPNVEVSFEEIELIQNEAPVDVSLTLHGKIPLGIVADCFLLEEGLDHEGCPDACLKPTWLKAKDWTVKHVGKGIYSGLDLCMIEHLDRVLSMGLKYFRIESGYETESYRNGVGRVYRDGIEKLLTGTPFSDREWEKTLRKYSHIGFCNGYLFGRSGRVYINRKGEEIPQ